uniref:C2H2-type domain-containing protein n=1 Tax=Cacopsylla melanoneura TaxID=428564 RepID=A0A8D9E561_9HEMI
MLKLSTTLFKCSCFIVLFKSSNAEIQEEDWNELTFVLLTMKCIYKKLQHYVQNKPCLTTPIPLEKLKLASRASIRKRSKKFPCPECNQTCTAFIALWRHMRARHNLDIGSSVARYKPNIVTSVGTEHNLDIASKVVFSGS